MTPREAYHALRRARSREVRLSGLPGHGRAAIALGAAVYARELATGRRVEEPARGLWLRQAEIERAAMGRSA